MTITPAIIGIDIAKHHLDVFDASLGTGNRVANEEAAVASLVARVAATGAFVVFEATGHYDRCLRQALAEAGVGYARVDPGRARAFARAAGFLAKTDTVDAKMLAALGQCLRPKADTPAEPSRERLGLLHKRRDQLVATCKQERTRGRETS